MVVSHRTGRSILLLSTRAYHALTLSAVYGRVIMFVLAAAMCGAPVHLHICRRGLRDQWGQDGKVLISCLEGEKEKRKSGQQIGKHVHIPMARAPE